MTQLDHLLVDLDRLRANGAIERIAADPASETFNRDKTTSFIAVPLKDLIRARAVIDVDVTIPASSTSAAIRSPAWYREKCEAQSRAVWRKQLTDEEASWDLWFWHQVAMTLPPPDGWRRHVVGSWR